MLGLPKIRISVLGYLIAFSTPSKVGLIPSLSANTTALAPIFNKVISGIGRPKIALACSSNSDKFCVPAKVTIPVSCGRGDNSLKYTPSSAKKNSTPQIPAPVNASVTFTAIFCASSRCASEICAGCQLSW